jgi:hypothetical protein
VNSAFPVGPGIRNDEGTDVLIFGVLATLTSAGVGGFLAWENRDTVVRVQIGDHAWTGHLYGVLILGALLACWFLLGISCIHLRMSERRHRRAAPVEPITEAAAASTTAAPTSDTAAPPAGNSAPPTASPGAPASRQRRRHAGRHVGAVGLR